jgi:hypothetical protein
MFLIDSKRKRKVSQDLKERCKEFWVTTGVKDHEGTEYVNTEDL